MKIRDISELIAETINDVIINKWKHEGFVDGCTNDQVCLVVDNKRYYINITEGDYSKEWKPEPADTLNIFKEGVGIER